jgi:hypothetical protein
VIVREDGDDLVLVRQADHALLSGWLAAAWGAPPWTPPRPYGGAVVGARLHDLAWTAFDETLPCRPDGRPFAFHEVARSVTTRLYRMGVDAVQAVDPYAGLLTSLHLSGFFTSHWAWRHWAPPPASEGEDGKAIVRFVEHELARQLRLREELQIHDTDRERELMCNYIWLQLWDRLSLYVCWFGFTGWSGDFPAAPLSTEPGAEAVSLHVELEPGGVCRLDPYPLLPRPYRARLPAVRLPLGLVAHAEELRQAWLAGGADTVEVAFQPA